MREIYKDKDGQPYDPIKKFGVIESEGALLYDNITTSYPLNLPTEYYHNAIKNSMPTNEEKWFIRPHHLESLTNHKQSIKTIYNASTSSSTVIPFTSSTPEISFLVQVAGQQSVG